MPLTAYRLIGFYNRDEKCLQRGTDWVFKYSSLRFVFRWLKVEFTLLSAIKAQCGIRGIATLYWGGWWRPRSGRFTPGIDPVSLVEEPGGAQCRSGRMRDNLAPHRYWITHCPDRSESVYELRHPGPLAAKVGRKIRLRCMFLYTLSRVIEGQFAFSCAVVPTLPHGLRH